MKLELQELGNPHAIVITGIRSMFVASKDDSDNYSDLDECKPSPCYKMTFLQYSQRSLVTYSDLDSIPELSGGPTPMPTPSVLHIEADGLIIPSFAPSSASGIGDDFLAARIIRAAADTGAQGFDVSEIGSQVDIPVSAAALSSATAPAAPPTDAAFNNPAAPDVVLTTAITLVPRTPQEVESSVTGLPEEGKWYTVTQGRHPGVYPDMYALSCTFEAPLTIHLQAAGRPAGSRHLIKLLRWCEG